jgi:6-phosphogluconate dehydrogenase
VADEDKTAFVADLKDAVYCAFLAAFAQGLNLIARASDDEGWGVKLHECIHIWRAGCIIRAAHIADLLQPLLERHAGCTNVLALQPVADEIRRTAPALKRVVARGVEWDAHMFVRGDLSPSLDTDGRFDNSPTLSATLEYIKYCAGPHLPTQFMEAQLDYFGAHSFDDKSEPAGEVKKGSSAHYLFNSTAKCTQVKPTSSGSLRKVILMQYTSSTYNRVQ